VNFSERISQSLLHQKKITNSNTENNKADANKCVCLIYWEGECEMQLMKFVTRDTKDKNKILVWCTTNRLITFRDFMQYVLDNVKNPKDFMIVDTEKDLVYDMYKVATEMYGMKKRTFEERMNGVATGKWNKYSNSELKGM
jgi:hypothetical protein